MSPINKRRKLEDGEYEVTPTTTSTTTTTTNVSEVDLAAAPVAPASSSEQAKATDQNRSLFVRSLPASVTTERLTEHFSESFPLKHATVVIDSQTKISKGFGFVTFADAEDAQAAIQQFNDSVLDGRKIKVELAQARHRDADDDLTGVVTGKGRKGGVNTTAVQLREKREQGRKEAQPPKLIVRNLPWSIKTAEDLSLLFRSYGKVKHAVVPSKGPRTQYGFGIVVLRGKKNAEKALAGINGKVVDGRTLAVDWAVDKDTWEEQKNATAEEAKLNKTDAVGVVEDEKVENDELEEDAAAAIEDGQEHDDETSSDDVDMDVEESDLDDEDEDDEEDSEDGDVKTNSNDTTVFVRNVPFTTTDEMLSAHFSTFGPVRYARVVYDPETERSRGTGFVCFFNVDDAKSCVKGAPKHEIAAAGHDESKDKKRKVDTLKHSILQNEASDPSGKYTLEGRVLNVVRALSREGAEKRANEASEQRDIRDRDKRRLYLLSEGSVARGSKLADALGKAEMDIRESSQRQRQRLIKSNPNLGLSLTRLSIRNIPRHIGSKELKALAREAVVGFAQDVKAGIRQPLSKDEMSRGDAEMREAEKRRKEQGKGIVRQAKVVFEDREGAKVTEGGGRSRGYGFIEYVSHRNALAGLRWLNGHSIKSGGEKPKRLIVEFAIENAQVVQRRNERERRAKERPAGERREDRKNGKDERGPKGQKRKRNNATEEKTAQGPKTVVSTNGPEEGEGDSEQKNRVAKRNRIIAKKRQARKARKG
ncbi:hypothetical protein PV10_08488 [Exophiala mesophila]|uniref:RRM domain-containing protein n=1 Tax=Exophiala mesophila TaxID=212818 RepID=A0A0D1WIZ4_EXOME|nr:uncharacterized protein PV10_08488 [Exophiala mesophila]KIV88850.1 hypothetical protein PV10_08488 [Exophiala mesophila]